MDNPREHEKLSIFFYLGALTNNSMIRMDPRVLPCSFAAFCEKILQLRTNFFISYEVATFRTKKALKKQKTD